MLALLAWLQLLLMVVPGTPQEAMFHQSSSSGFKMRNKADLWCMTTNVVWQKRVMTTAILNKWLATSPLWRKREIIVNHRSRRDASERWQNDLCVCLKKRTSWGQHERCEGGGHWRQQNINWFSSRFSHQSGRTRNRFEGTVSTTEQTLDANYQDVSLQIWQIKNSDSEIFRF